jgi:hypothetical protein
MEHIEQFKNIFPEYAKTYEKIMSILNVDKSDSVTKFNELIADADKLFEFAINNEILEIVVFLYGYKNHAYDEKLLKLFSIFEDDCEKLDIGRVVKYGKDIVAKKGSNAQHFNPCIEYLDRMKKYSKRSIIKGSGCKYSLNPKYLYNENEQLVL